MKKDKRRSVPITTRVTEEYKEALNELAKKSRLSLSDYLLGGRVKEIIKWLANNKKHVE